MKYSLFGQGEGVRAEGTAERLGERFASVRQGVISDASTPARQLGVHPGLTVATARALLPELVLQAEPERPSTRMEAVWALLGSCSPWLQTVSPDSFWLQIPGPSSLHGMTSVVNEVRHILKQMEAVAPGVIRFRTGLAETPFLARALVEWSRWERVPGAEYRRVGGQQWLISPSFVAGEGASLGAWMHRLPVAALWPLSQSERAALQRLGLRRLEELADFGADRLRRHFGRSGLQWLRWLDPQSAEAAVSVNYPPLEFETTWQSEVGNPASAEQAPQILQQLVCQLASKLERASLGARRLTLDWQTDIGTGHAERITKQPLFSATSMLGPLQSAAEQCRRERTALERMAVGASELRPLSAVQMKFEIHDGRLVDSGRPELQPLRQLIGQVNRKFPGRLQRGARAGFRELRLQAVLGT